MELILIEAGMRWFFSLSFSLSHLLFIWFLLCLIISSGCVCYLFIAVDLFMQWNIYWCVFQLFSCWYTRRRRAKFIHSLKKNPNENQNGCCCRGILWICRKQGNCADDGCETNGTSADRKWCKIASTHKLNINSGWKWWNQLISAIAMVDWTVTFTFRFGHLFFRQWKSR